MKKLIIALALSTGLFGGSFATVDCTEMSKVIDLLQGYTKVCHVDTNTHAFVQEINKNGTGTIEYEDGEIIPFTTENNTFSVNIEADRPFRFIIEDFTSDKFKLSLLSDGSESWKYFYEGTNRWRKYDFAPIEVTPPVYVGVHNYKLIPETGILNYSEDPSYVFKAEASTVNGTLNSVEVQMSTVIGKSYRLSIHTDKAVKLWFDGSSHATELVSDTNTLVEVNNIVATRTLTKIWIQPQETGIVTVSELDIVEYNPPVEAAVMVKGRILREDRTPFEDVKVQLITEDTAYESVTDATGTFQTFIDIGIPFTVQAFNILNIPPSWALYENQIKITKDLVTVEENNGVWTESIKHFDIVEIRPKFITDIGTRNYNQISYNSVSFTPGDATIPNQGIRVLFPLKAGVEYSITANVSHNTSLWVTDKATVKLLQPNKIINSSDTEIAKFTALGETMLYFAPKEQADYIIKDIKITW